MMFLGLNIKWNSYMQQSESLDFFFYASIPIVGVLLGAFVTAMVHSSAATIGLVMVLSQAGLLDLQSAICNVRRQYRDMPYCSVGKYDREYKCKENCLGSYLL